MNPDIINKGERCIGEKVDANKKLACENAMIRARLMFNDANRGNINTDTWMEDIRNSSITEADEPAKLFIKSVKNNKLAHDHNTPALFCHGYAMNALSYLD
uniref:Uncharacterized protein n=1 Tax=Schizaphis graminum TaxID=13262 RepID=A0A2S2PPM6_SCHGA